MRNREVHDAKNQLAMFASSCCPERPVQAGFSPPIRAGDMASLIFRIVYLTVCSSSGLRLTGLRAGKPEPSVDSALHYSTRGVRHGTVVAPGMMDSTR